MDLLTKLVYQRAKFRLKELEAYQDNAEEIQREQLSKVLMRMHGTEFAQRYGLDKNSSYCDFASRVPVQRYDDCKADIERMIKGEKNVLIPEQCSWYAKSSGTTSDKSKFIPVPKRHLNQCHYLGGRDTLWLYLRNNPDSELLKTKALILGGSHSSTAINSASRAGDLSSILVEHMPMLGDFMRVPSKETLLMNEWTAKMQAIVEEVEQANVGSLSGVPSWMMVLLSKILEHTGRENISELWPNLEVFFHGGISFEPYRDAYQKIIPSDKMHYEETYNASEGFFGIQDEPSIRAMRLMLDYGVFYEFVELDDLDEEAEVICQPQNIKALWEVEAHKKYAILITTLGGLYRYLIGDTVSFVSLNPYRFIISGRTKHYINAFGEELMVDNADRALAIACNKTGAKVSEYTAAPQFFHEKSKGRHDWLIEFGEEPKDLQAFASILDKELQEQNSDYEAKRYKDMTLLPLSLTVAPKGLFHSWLANKGKLGGQHKIPRLANHRTYLDELLSLLN